LDCLTARRRRIRRALVAGWHPAVPGAV